MEKTITISGKSIAYLLHAVTLSMLVLFIFILVRTDRPASVPLAVFFASVVLAMVVGLWRWKTGRDGDHLGTAGDLVYDPLAPGQMAKERWLQSVRRLPGADVEGDEEENDDEGEAA
ncbi:hypothetical protein [Halopiger xanaduensis]|uniref:Uncharacterized protein n=1 Tax=Halopiger xanaduensis (strain DSM 18323 / JCM 14033 / SH-6) TaxID=797210 RepID=F8D6V1_HALXS|nr:hypothetical protein [Halopiger xanaduensis]AEH35895.1 hypothetical protein Halxa_1262 [Halopiger xanaduensis SH-6]